MGKAKRRKTNTRSQGVLDRAAHAIEMMAGMKMPRVQSDLPQEEKISHAMSVLLGFEVPEDSPLSVYKTALDLIVLSWNISLLDSDNQSEALEKFTASIGLANGAIRRQALDHMKKLIVRKKQLFPRDERVILSWDVWFERDDVRISAAAIYSS